ncbi:ComF family protein [Candidatus Peregrinibacteria bacterium]|nr:ComF family protein [Candidatus Peregrinibacteria bacterium]
MSIIKKIIYAVLNLIFPRQCVLCGATGAYLCGACLREKKYGGDAVHKLIELLKYKFSAEIAEILGRILYERYAGFLARAGRDLKCAGQENNWAIAFVPIHKKRFLFRGFNHAEKISRTVADLSGVPISDCLIKIRNTHPQVGLKRSERLTNLIDAFALRPGAAVAKNIILIDDVRTTGATLAECVKVLKKAGAVKIYEMVLRCG